MKKALIILCLGWLLGCSARNSGEVVESNDIRANFDLTDNSGNEVSLDKSRDRHLFVNFWATWCKPCIAELPSIVALRDSLADEPIDFVLVTNESPEQTDNFLNKRNVDIPGYHMADAVEAFELIGFPTTMLISPEGDILLKREGADEWNDPANVVRIKQLMDSK